jgi:RNA polymerase sigma-70 factor (ECF subfamily)
LLVFQDPDFFGHGQGHAVSTLDVRQITEEYFARIHRAALVMTGNPWDADDLAQETFMVLAGQIDRFQGRSSIYTWLYGILLNLERRKRRREGTWRRKLRVLWGGDASPTEAGAEAESPVEIAEWQRSLWAQVAKLPDGQRQTLVLRFSEHMSYEEIAEVLICPVGTVKSRMHHALASLRDRLSLLGDDFGIVLNVEDGELSSPARRSHAV